MPIIRVNEAQPGMVLNRDIESSSSGVIFLSSGTVLSSKNIELIVKQGITHINIMEKKESNHNRYIVVEDEVFFHSHEIVASKTREIMSNVKLGKKLIISELGETLDDLMNEIIKSNNILSKLRQLREIEEYTFRHSLNVSIMATMIGKWLGYSDIELKQIALAGLFHDIGKMKIPEDILNKPDKLTEKEYDLVKKHTIFGYNILKDTVGLSKSIAIASLQHHEREDGSGYPLNIKGHKIHEYAKILAICDVFDAMTSKRVYQNKKSPFIVAEHIANNSFGVLDGRISTIFLNNISKFYVGNVVKLSNGKIGEIIYVHKEIPTRPIVKIEDEYVDLLNDRSIEIVDVIY